MAGKVACCCVVVVSEGPEVAADALGSSAAGHSSEVVGVGTVTLICWTAATRSSRGGSGVWVSPEVCCCWRKDWKEVVGMDCIRAAQKLRSVRRRPAMVHTAESARGPEWDLAQGLQPQANICAVHPKQVQDQEQRTSDARSLISRHTAAAVTTTPAAQLTCVTGNWLAAASMLNMIGLTAPSVLVLVFLQQVCGGVSAA